jgi:inosine/xanthosine triphosphate pyrophosphatase family protein
VCLITTKSTEEENRKTPCKPAPKTHNRQEKKRGFIYTRRIFIFIKKAYKSLAKKHPQRKNLTTHRTAATQHSHPFNPSIQKSRSSKKGRGRRI